MDRCCIIYGKPYITFFAIQAQMHLDRTSLYGHCYDIDKTLRTSKPLIDSQVCIYIPAALWFYLALFYFCLI